MTDIASGATDTVVIDLTFTGVGPMRRVNSVQTRYVDEDMPDVSRVIAVRSKTRSASVTGTPDLGWDVASVHVSRQLEVQRPARP